MALKGYTKETYDAVMFTLKKYEYILNTLKFEISKNYTIMKILIVLYKISPKLLIYILNKTL